MAVHIYPLIILDGFH